MYMEAVFSGGDIVKQLPAEAKRFGNIDKSFMKVGTHPTHNPSVIRCSAWKNGNKHPGREDR